MKTRQNLVPNKDRFDSERQYEIARESIDKAYEAKYGKSGIEDMGYEQYEDFINRVLDDSDESAFRGTDEEIAEGWFDTEIFE